MAPVYDRIKNNDALTFEDLYKISNFEQLIETAFTQGAEQTAEKLRSQNDQRVNQVIRGNVPRRNAGGMPGKPWNHLKFLGEVKYGTFSFCLFF